MARLIGRTKSWILWLVGALCALLFGTGLPGCGNEPVVKYGPPPMQPPKPSPAASAQPTAKSTAAADWQAVVAAWELAMPLAQSGKSTTAERTAAEAKLKAAEAAIPRLAAAQELSAAEATLLTQEAANIRQDMLHLPPTDSIVECYKRAYLPPARQSLERLDQRLPLLEQLAAGGKVHPAAVAKVLAAVEADLATLGSEEALKLLPAEERAKAEETRTKVRAQVEALRQRLAPPALPVPTEDLRPMCYDMAPAGLLRRGAPSREELEARVALVERFAQSERLAPQVAARLRAEVARALDELRPL